MNAMPTGRLCYRNADCNEIVVYVNQNSEVLPPTPEFQYVRAYLKRLDDRRLVLEMRLDEHEFLSSVKG